MPIPTDEWQWDANQFWIAFVGSNPDFLQPGGLSVHIWDTCIRIAGPYITNHLGGAPALDELGRRKLWGVALMEQKQHTDFF